MNINTTVSYQNIIFNYYKIYENELPWNIVRYEIKNKQWMQCVWNLWKHLS